MTNGKTLVALAAVLCMTLTTQPAIAATLDNDGLRQEIIGTVLKASMGFMTVRVLHRPDGTSIMRGSMGSDNGSWNIKGGKICVRWQNRNKGQEQCMSLQPLGNGQYKSSHRGMVLTAEK